MLTILFHCQNTAAFTLFKIIKNFLLPIMKNNVYFLFFFFNPKKLFICIGLNGKVLVKHRHDLLCEKSKAVAPC